MGTVYFVGDKPTEDSMKCNRRLKSKFGKRDGATALNFYCKKKVEIGERIVKENESGRGCSRARWRHACCSLLSPMKPLPCCAAANVLYSETATAAAAAAGMKGHKTTCP